MLKIVIFASGSGTNAENIIKHFENKAVATVVSVFTNNPNAKVIDRAKKYKIPIEIFSKEELTDGKVLHKVKTFAPDLLVLAGFLLKLPKSIVESYPRSIINIHPALLPKYVARGVYGMNVHRAIVENKENETGLTIPYVYENYDDGNIIIQKKVPVLLMDLTVSCAEKKN